MTSEPLAPTRPVLTQPPLGISHLLLWILGAAVLLGIFRWDVTREDMTPPMQAVTVARQVCFGILGGVNIAALIIYTRRLLVRDAPLLTQPGHWLLAIVGIANLVMWSLLGLATAIRVLMGEHDPLIILTVYQTLPWCAGYLLACILSVIALVVQREPLRWKICFTVWAVLSAILATVFAAMFQSAFGSSFLVAARLYEWIYPLDQGATFGLLSVALFMDGVDGRRRDWVHYVGVVVTILQSAIGLAMYYLDRWAQTAGM